MTAVTGDQRSGRRNEKRCTFTTCHPELRKRRKETSDHIFFNRGERFTYCTMRNSSYMCLDRCLKKRNKTIAIIYYTGGTTKKGKLGDVTTVRRRVQKSRKVDDESKTRHTTRQRREHIHKIQARYKKRIGEQLVDEKRFSTHRAHEAVASPFIESSPKSKRKGKGEDEHGCHYGCSLQLW